jgi:hypothetical protein
VLEAHARKDFDDDTRIELLCLIGNALVFCFDFDYTTSQKALAAARQFWPAPGSEDTELGVLMEPE